MMFIVKTQDGKRLINMDNIDEIFIRDNCIYYKSTLLGKYHNENGCLEVLDSLFREIEKPMKQEEDVAKFGTVYLYYVNKTFKMPDECKYNPRCRKINY